jgi:uncharacterized protein YkwD
MALTLALGSTAQPAAAQSCPDASLTPASDNLDRIDDAVFCLINDQRSQQDQPPLSRRPQLDQSASFQSADMVAHHYFAHDHPGRPSLWERISWTGYFEQAVTGLYAENLLNGPQGTTTPSVMVDAWMESPDHRSNILDPRLHDIGLGASIAPPDGAFYPDQPAVVITTDFGARVLASPGCGQPSGSGQQPSASVASRRASCAGPGPRQPRKRKPHPVKRRHPRRHR